MSEQNRTLLAISLMGLILLIFFSDWYQEIVAPGSTDPVKPHIESSFSATSDSSVVFEPETTIQDIPTPTPLDTSRPLTANETLIIVSTPLYEIHLSNRSGGTLKKV